MEKKTTALGTVNNEVDFCNCLLYTSDAADD